MVTETHPAVAPVHNDPRTAPTLVFELFAVEGDVERALDEYASERAQSLLDAGVATGANVFRLREQPVPGSPLARDVSSRLPEGYAERLMLFREPPGPAKPLPAVPGTRGAPQVDFTARVALSYKSATPIVQKRC